MAAWADESAAYITLDRKIRELLAERMENGATDQLDRRRAALIEERRRVERAGWWN
jgi:hypothetical protein